MDRKPYKISNEEGRRRKRPKLEPNFLKKDQYAYLRAGLNGSTKLGYKKKTENYHLESRSWNLEPYRSTFEFLAKNLRT